MKEPLSKTRKSPRGQTSRGLRATLPKPVGGKALARLAQFEKSRGLDDHPSAMKDGRDAGQAVDTLYLDAFNTLQKMQMAPLTDMAVPIPQGWRPLGPFCIPHGQTYGSGAGSRPSISGRVSALAVDPGNANHLLAGAAGGGVWESRDAGATWTSRTDNQPSLATGAIAFDPSNPMRVYAGTGEGNFFARLGAGLLRSLDGGATWAMLSVAPFSGQGFYDLLVDSLNGNHLLAACSLGLYESTDGGGTWNQRRNQLTWDLSMHPAVAGDSNSTHEVFAACSGGLFRSTDGGTTWAAVNLPGAPSNYNRMAVCHAPSNGAVVYVFAASGDTAYLWRRTAFGGAFAAIAPMPAGLSTGQAWYDWFAAVAPNNADVIYLGAIEVHKGVRANNAWSWSTISAKNGGDSIHPDQHAITFSPANANVVYIGNDGGVYRSPDAGNTWKSLNKNLAITEFEFIAQHPEFEAWLLGGTQDNGTLRYEGQEIWYHVQDGDGGDCGLNETTPATCFHSFYGIWVERSTSGGGWGTWQNVSPPASANYSALFYPPMEVNGSVVARAGQSLFMSNNNGTNWTEVALPANLLASALTVSSATRVYVGTTNGRIFRSDFAAGGWGAVVELGSPGAGRYISDLMVDPTNANRIWATSSTAIGGHVFRSDNGGAAWINVSAGLPNIPVNAIEIDPAHPNTVWVAADVGIYRSVNAGTAWQAFSNLLPNALVKDLLFHAPSRLLRAATQSRGVWEIAVDQGTMPDVEVYLRDSVVDTGRLMPSPSGVTDPFSPGSTTWWWQCTDIKVDMPPYQFPNMADVDFERFEDDHGVFAAGLVHEDAQRNRLARVYVQIHNRGLNPAVNMAVRVFYANASAGLPALPANFWTGFPNNALAASSPWQPVAPHKVLSSVACGRGQIVGFEWPVPAGAANHTCLLAVISAENDKIAAGMLNVGTLVTSSKKAGLKNLSVINPPAAIGPQLRVIPIELWGSRESKSFHITMDAGAKSLAQAVILPTDLGKYGEALRLKTIDVDEEAMQAAQILLKDRPALRKLFDIRKAIVPNRLGGVLSAVPLETKSPQTVLVILKPAVRPGYGSIVQTDSQGNVVGGYTFKAI